ncbi:MAG TPA: ribosome maturation factor RimM [Fimbriimonas sp.]
MADLIRVGRISGVFGLRGHLKIEPLTDFWERFQEGRELYLKGKPVKIETSTTHKGRPLLKLEGVDSATQAEALQFEFLEGLADEEFELEEDEYYTEELVGLRVVTVDGRELGELDEVHRYPAHDVFEVGGIMIPAVKQFVRNVDIEGGTITVELIEGMEE